MQFTTPPKGDEILMLSDPAHLSSRFDRAMIRACLWRAFRSARCVSERASERAATSHWPDTHDERGDEEETDDARAGDDDEQLRAVQLAVRRSLCVRKTHWLINYEFDAVLWRTPCSS